MRDQSLSCFCLQILSILSLLFAFVLLEHPQYFVEDKLNIIEEKNNKFHEEVFNESENKFDVPINNIQDAINDPSEIGDVWDAKDKNEKDNDMTDNSRNNSSEASENGDNKGNGQHIF